MVENFWFPIGTNLLSSLIIWAVTKVAGRRARSRPQLTGWPAWVFAILVVIWATAQFATLRYVAVTQNPWWGLLVVVLSTVGLIVFVVVQLTRFWRVGLRQASSTSNQLAAIDSSLKLINSSFSFLGTGASKLTKNPEFENAVLRCTTSGSEVRLLLSKPDTAGLAEFARRAGKSPDAYTKIVTESLRRIKDLHKDKGAKVQVRFYNGERRFRLMFIDADECFASYNVYGRNNDLGSPAIRITRNSVDPTESFYWGFLRYFDDEWELAEEWDYIEYL